MKKYYSETIENIPYGILSCSVFDQELSVVEISKAHIKLRLFDLQKIVVGEIVPVSFKSFSWEKSGYENMTDIMAEVTAVYDMDDWYEIVLEINNVCYSKIVQQLQTQYFRYIQLKTESFGNEFSEKLTGYPADADNLFSDSYEEWKDRFDASALLKEISDLPEKIAVAVSLENKAGYSKYINGDYPLKDKIKHVYIGNAYCPYLFPGADILPALIAKAKEYGHGITFVLSYLREEYLSEEKTKIEKLKELCHEYEVSVELELNDWGYIDMLRSAIMKIEVMKTEVMKTEVMKTEINKPGFDENKCIFTYTFGRLLNKQKKDPRYHYKNGLNEYGKFLTGNSTDDTEFCDMLRSLGVMSVESEMSLPGSIVEEMEMTDNVSNAVNDGSMNMHLHLPFYQTNTSQFCPLYSYAKYGDRGHQALPKDCIDGKCAVCDEKVFLYADHLNLVGRYNSLFGINKDLLESPELLKKYCKMRDVNRIVWNYVN